MAKGKTFLGLKRGRAAGLVYSVGRTSDGSRQQVVRGIPEAVSNPKSYGQAVTRSYLAAASRIASTFAVISDHSYEGVVAGQPGRSAFISGIMRETIGQRPYSYRNVSGYFGDATSTMFPVSRGSMGEVRVAPIQAPADSVPAASDYTQIETWSDQVMAALNLINGDIVTFISTPLSNSRGAVVGSAVATQAIVSAGESLAPVPGMPYLQDIKFAVSGSIIWMSGKVGLQGHGFSALCAVIFERRVGDAYLRSTSFGMVPRSDSGDAAAAIDTYRPGVAASVGYGPNYLDGDDIPVAP